MKKLNPANSFLTHFALAVLAFRLAGQSAFAQVTLPFHDEFPASLGSGNLGPGGVDSTIWSLGASSGDITVGSAYALTPPAGLQLPAAGGEGVNVALPGLASNTQRDVGLQFAAINSGAVYVSFLLQVNTNVSVATYKDIVCLNTVTTGFPNTSGKVNIMLNNTGLSINKGANAAPTVYTGSQTTAALGTTTHMVVARYTFNTTSSIDDTVDLWLDPPNTSFGTVTPPTPVVGGVGVGTNDATSLASVTIHLNTSSAAAAGDWWIDEFRVGTNWAQVTPSSAPNVPTGVSALPFDSLVTVSWTASASDASHPNATGYNVKRSTTSGGPYTTLSAGANVASSPFNDTTAVNGTTYYYVVSAISSVANTTESANCSPEAVAMPTGSSPPTTSPTIASITPACSSVAMSWNSISDATKYYIYRKLSGGSYVTALATNVGVNNTSYTDNTAVAGNTYVYAATSVNGNGENPTKNDSAAVAINTPGIETQPASVMTGDGGFTAQFTVVATGNSLTYQWQVSTDNGSTWNNVITGGSTSSYTTSTATTAMNGYQYRCIVTGSGCTITQVASSAATLNVGTHFRSIASGNWSGASPAAGWQVSLDGSAGWTAAATNAIPGATDTVEIQTNTSLIVDTNVACAQMTIDQGGTLENTTGSAQTRLQLYGDLAADNGAGSFATGSTAHSTVLEFTSGTCHWTGSGNTSSGRFQVTVDSAGTLDISSVTNLVEFRSSGNVPFVVNGTLIVGNTVIFMNNNSSTTFSNSPGSTIVTANPNGLAVGTYNSSPDSSTPTIDFAPAQVSLSTGANYVFNGTSAQVTLGLPATVNNLIITNTAGVTLSSPVNVSAQLQINNGVLNMTGDGTSTAGTLSFNGGVTLQSAGSWGSTASGATYRNNSYFAGVSGDVLNVSSGPKFFKSNGTGGGNWSANATWQESTDGVHYNPSVADVPDSSSTKIEILADDHVTNDVAGQSMASTVIDAHGQLTINPGITVTLASGISSLSLTNNGTFLNQGTVIWSQWALNAGATYIHYNTNAPGTTAYANAIINPASTWIYAGSSTVATPLATSGRVYGNLIIKSADGSTYSTAAANTGTLTVQGDFTLGSSVTLSNTQTGAWILNGNFTNNGTLNNYSNEVITFTGAGKAIAGTANPIPLVDFNINSGANIAIAQNIHATGNFALAGNAAFNVNKSLSPSNVLVTVDGTLSNTGGGNGITVNNAGPALVAGDSFKLFSGIVASGNLLAIGGGGLGGGLTWENDLASNGSIKVVSSVVTPPVLGVTQSGNTLTFNWAGSYKLQSQTNALNAGLKTNWFDYPGGGISGVNVTINPENPTVFFRLSQ